MGRRGRRLDAQPVFPQLRKYQVRSGTYTSCQNRKFLMIIAHLYLARRTPAQRERSFGSCSQPNLLNHIGLPEEGLVPVCQPSALRSSAAGSAVGYGPSRLVTVST